jgi:cation diffusion facilitator CzcD-associated flavoprotein CzcO
MSDPYVLIIGSGFAGLGMAIRLKQAGIDDFVVLEQASGIGGTWRDNHYPGAACDVPSHLYSFSFEPWPEWSREFAPQKEILAYLEHCADKYGIRPHIRFGARVTRAGWDEDRGIWEVETSDGAKLRARVLVPGCGPLSRPVLPDIPGLEGFRGKTFHSARWDHSFPLEGKSVAVVGTGASAIQIVPEIAPRVGKLFVYQRTAPWVVPKPDGEIPAWKRAAFRRMPAAQQLARQRLYWTRELMALGFVVEPKIMKLGERFGRSYLRKKVADPVLRDKLTPRYTMGCKRVLPTNDYLPALQRPNVELVTAPIDEVRAHSIATNDGVDRAVDAIVLATGFEAAEQVAPFEIRGRGGRELNEVWTEGAEAYLGTSVAGFPNLCAGRVQRAPAAAPREHRLGQRLHELVPHAHGEEHDALAGIHLRVPLEDAPLRRERLRRAHRPQLDRSAHAPAITTSSRSFTFTCSATASGRTCQPSVTSVSAGHTGRRNCASKAVIRVASPPHTARATWRTMKPNEQSPCRMGPRSKPTPRANSGSACSGLRSPESL